MQNMTEYEIKQLMCDIGKRVWEKGMVAANDGNFSVKLNDNEFKSILFSLLNININCFIAINYSAFSYISLTFKYIS